MFDGPNIARIADLIRDSARATVLGALMADRALTATELVHLTGVTKQTISAHMKKLVDAELVSVVAQGRHRYFRLANPDVARLLEALMGVAARTGAVRVRSSPREPALRRARVCYDHLAGELAVAAYRTMERKGFFADTRDSRFVLSTQGETWFRQWGISLDALKSDRRPLCRACLDWSERRHHLAGGLGKALLDHLYALDWARPSKNSRVVHFTELGEREFQRKVCQ